MPNGFNEGQASQIVAIDFRTLPGGPYDRFSGGRTLVSAGRALARQCLSSRRPRPRDPASSCARAQAACARSEPHARRPARALPSRTPLPCTCILTPKLPSSRRTNWATTSG